MSEDYFKVYRALNRQRLVAEKRTYRQLHRDRVKDNCKNYYRANTDRCKALTKEWQVKNADKLRFYNANRRAAKLKRTPQWLTEVHWEQIKFFYKQAQELTIKTSIKHEVDHIIPLRGDTVSGLHVPWNLQILTKSENCHKSNK